MIKLSSSMLDIYKVLFVWKDGSVILWPKWYKKLIPNQMNLIHGKVCTVNQAACTFDYVIIGFFTCFSEGISLTLDFGKYRQSWSKQKINDKRVIQVIRVIVKILLLPWIQWMERYETNGNFLVFRSVGSLVSLIQLSKQIEH